MLWSCDDDDDVKPAGKKTISFIHEYTHKKLSDDADGHTVK